MKVLFACVCDHASADQVGKLSVSGIFDRIQSEKFPAKHQRMYLVFRLSFEYDDNSKTHKLDIRLLDEDSQPLLEAEAEIETGRMLPGEFQTMNQIIELNDLILKKPGRYKFVLSTGGQDQFEVPLAVVKP